MRALRHAIPADEAARAAEAAAAHVAACAPFRAAARVALYRARGGEIPTAPLEHLARAAGKCILLPRIPPGASALEFAIHRPGAALRAGRYGVPEPDGPAQLLAETDLVIVPGLAFDAAGWRLGTGGGWYDRTFPRGEPAPRLVGLAYHAQLVEEVPHGPWDRAVDAVATERACRASRRTERTG